MAGMRSSVVALVLLFCGLVCAFDSSFYTGGSQVIAPLDYTVFWKADLPANTLYLALKAKTTGWVGFGIAEITSGSMPGADIMVGYYNTTDKKGRITDRWSYARAKPVEDDCQDVVLVSAEEADGYTIIEAKRPINTTDPQDRPIEYGPNRIIVSFGTDDELQYHGSNRKTDQITFYGAPLYSSVPVEGEMTLELTMDNFVVPNEDTIYACQAFSLPVDQEYTITQIDPIVNQANIAHVHHFLAHICINESTYEAPLVSTYHNKPGVCDSPLGNVFQGCIGLMSAWAAGGGSTYTPAEAGFAMGIKASAIKFIILEVHYNNPGGTAGYSDNSGIRIHYSTTPRKYEAAVLTLGDPLVNLDVIPPNSITEFELECLSGCTSGFAHNITAFLSFPHMHKVGSRIWTSQWRDGEKINEFGRVEFWTFDHQQVQPVNFTINQGDRLNTHCVYDTTGISTPVKFGARSSDEMCMHFVSYYPRLLITRNGTELPYAFCGLSYFQNSTLCGNVEDNVNVNNPEHHDPLGRANRTFGVHPKVCLDGHTPTTSGPSSTTTSRTTDQESSGSAIFATITVIASVLVMALF